MAKHHTVFLREAMVLTEESGREHVLPIRKVTSLDGEMVTRRRTEVPAGHRPD
jgi:hypothetical protein